MKQFFSKITSDHWKHKNKAEKAAHDVAMDMERRILKQSEVTAYRKEFTERIAQVNADHPRCKDLGLSIWIPLNREDTLFTVSGVFHLELFKVKDACQ